MQHLESFTLIATIFGTPRKVSFDSLSGMSIAGLHPNEARAIAQTLEMATADKPLLVDQPKPAPEAPINRAKWASPSRML